MLLQAALEHSLKMLWMNIPKYIYSSFGWRSCFQFFAILSNATESSLICVGNFSLGLCVGGISWFQALHLYFDEMLINWSVLPANYRFPDDGIGVLAAWHLHLPWLNDDHGWKMRICISHMAGEAKVPFAIWSRFYPCPFSIALSTLTILRDCEFLIQTLFPVVLVETAFNLSLHLFTLFRVSLLYRSLQLQLI